MNDSSVIIKKYENRRLYDTTTSRYVNLGEVAEMIRRGLGVQVVDARTGEDLTRVILTQIIVDDAKDRHAGLPLELLRQIIVSSDKAGHEFIAWYLKTAIDAYQTVQEGLQSQLKEARTVAMAPIEMVKSFFTGSKSAETGIEEELQALRTRVAELEARLEKG